MKLQIPRREGIRKTNPEDCVELHYTPILRRAYLRRLEMALGLMGKGPFRRILDVGCAGGIFFPELGRRCHELYGIDEHEHLNWTKELARKEGLRVHLARGRAEALPFGRGSFDCVICLSVLVYMGDRLTQTVEDLARVLRPGGVLIVGSSVLTWLTRGLYRVIGHGDSLLLYRSDHRAILDALRRRFGIGQVAHFPAWVPLGSSLFFCCRCQLR